MDPRPLSKNLFKNLSFNDIEYLLEQVVEARNAAFDANPELEIKAPRHGWHCFHCGLVFYHEHQARWHFGETSNATPICQLPKDVLEWALLVRGLEQKLAACREKHTQT